MHDARNARTDRDNTFALQILYDGFLEHQDGHICDEDTEAVLFENNPVAATDQPGSIRWRTM